MSDESEMRAAREAYEQAFVTMPELLAKDERGRYLDPRVLAEHAAYERGWLAAREQPPAEWSRDVPTEAGWHWARIVENGPDAEWFPQRVFIDGASGESELIDCPLRPDELEWCGPRIPEPEVK